MLRIHNLTHEQIEMLNKLWSMDSMDKIRAFRATLPRLRQQQIDTLLEMVRLQIIDDEIDADPQNLIIAQELLWPLDNKKD